MAVALAWRRVNMNKQDRFPSLNEPSPPPSSSGLALVRCCASQYTLITGLQLLNMSSSAHTRLQELQMICCSLLAGETLEFNHDREFWKNLVEGTTPVESVSGDMQIPASVSLTIQVTAVDVWLSITFPVGGAGPALITVKSDTLPRAEAISLQRMVNDKVEEAKDEE